jgi:hypothetical protein
MKMPAACAVLLLLGSLLGANENVKDSAGYLALQRATR